MRHKSPRRRRKRSRSSKPRRWRSGRTISSRDLQRLLLVSRDTAQEIVDDARGEPVVIAARAMGMRGNVLLRHSASFSIRRSAARSSACSI